MPGKDSGDSSSTHARDAANAAATHADNAAKDADDAAAHAGQAATAAAQSAAHAKSAQQAADAATAAVAKAKKTHDIAVRIEAEGLTERTNAGIAQARDLKARQDQRAAADAAAAQQVKDVDTQAKTLATQAAQPGADPKALAPAGRKVALAMMQTSGPWSRGAAEVALTGTDQDVVDYLSTLRAQAAQQDDRYRVQTLARESSLASVRTAAEEALKGSDDQVSAFLATGQYEAGAQDFRVAIAQIIDAGGPVVQETGRAALDSDDPQKYRQFLTTGQYQARTQDQRVRAAQLIGSGGPQVKSAARIALEGPDDLLDQFIQVGQYKAQRQDFLGATHTAQIQQLIADAAGVAATAQKNAAEAHKAAATAIKAADQAANWAKQADASAKQAKGYADQAAKSADDAKASADQAAASARTAAKAAASANQAASDAAVSAVDAAGSAQWAQLSATAAYAAGDRARASAIAAGKDYKAADQAFKDAFQATVEKKEAEREAAEKDTGSQAEARYRCGLLGCDAAEHPAHWCQHNETLCDLLSMGPGAEAAAKQLWDVEKDLLGLGQLEACKGGNVIACTQLAEDLTLRSKFKLLERGMEALEDLRSARYVKSCSHCFPAGTRVLMANARTRKIETVHPGDSVLATDPLTGRTAPRKVSRLIITDGDKHFDELTIATPDGPRKLTATYEHPFWSPSAHQWVKARELTSGATLLTSRRTVVRVQANRPFDQHARTYNLTVDDLHTYYVLAGKTPVLVHNTQCDPPFLDAAGETYVRSKHMPGGAKADATKGLFNKDADLYKLADDAGEFEPKLQDNGNYVRVGNAPDIIGTDVETGLPTKTYTVVTDKWGNVVTMHPGVPR
ncbi:polymorphic toxin-type HINT domain-containing protein [Streptomyces sp. NPDC093261]|uniref:polymorphic toxin-type HINT domain-containing protein n=1 Tax=Streptomyces sp. NPDC093261 TaxID=3366037 RepID=UPI0038170205